MDNMPLVSITIPSYNSEKMIPFCLEGVSKQTYPNIETLVIDSHSTDRTRDIAAKFGAKVIECEGKLLAARYLGYKESKGKYVALVDTDQILKPNTIEKAVALINDYDMLIFEEHSYNTKGFIPKLCSASKQMVNARYAKSYAFDPTKGANLARFFKKEILEKAFAAIPQELIPSTIHGDHDMISYESYRISQRVGVLEDAIYAVEPGWRTLWRRYYRYGASLRTIKKSYYWDLFMRKKGSGLWFFGRPISLGLQTLLLTMIVKIIVKLGYYFGHKIVIEVIEPKKK